MIDRHARVNKAWLLLSAVLHISPVSGLQKHTGELEMFLRQHGQGPESPRGIGVTAWRTTAGCPALYWNLEKTCRVESGP